MLRIRRSADRGFMDHGWLKTYHSFSFADYYDAEHMGFRSLRVINQDVISPRTGFPPHSHRDMEIITYVLRGELAHMDTMGLERHVAALRPGEIQYMSAGTGIRHSEFNASATDDLELLQIWIQPRQAGLAPRYGQSVLNTEAMSRGLHLIVSDIGGGGDVEINQDIKLFAARINSGQRIKCRPDPGRGMWLQLIAGQLELEDGDQSAVMVPGDAAAFEGDELVMTMDNRGSELLLFDLA